MVEFRLLNAYSYAWKTTFPGTLATVPSTLQIFSSIDLSQGFFHLLVCKELQKLFYFGANGKRYCYQQLPKDGHLTLTFLMLG